MKLTALALGLALGLVDASSSSSSFLSSPSPVVDVGAYIAEAVATVIDAAPSNHVRSLREQSFTPPTMAKHYAASVRDGVPSSATFKLTSYEVYDEDMQFRATASNEVLPFNNGTYGLNVTTLLAANTSYLIISERCQPLPAQDKFFSMWSWLPVATFQGNTTVDNRPCELWTLDIPSKSTSLGVCVDSVSQRFPVQYNVTIPGWVSQCCCRVSPCACLCGHGGACMLTHTYTRARALQSVLSLHVSLSHCEPTNL